jgi:hypothetical protein
MFFLSDGKLDIENRSNQTGTTGFSDNLAISFELLVQAAK